MKGFGGKGGFGGGFGGGPGGMWDGGFGGNFGGWGGPMMFGGGKGGWGGFKGGWGGWGGGGGWGRGNSYKKALPEGTVVDKEARYQGRVTSYNKWSGFGWVELDQKGIIPDDKAYVHWKSLQSEDRFPFLNEGMTVEFGLHRYTNKSGDKAFVRAKVVSLPGGAKIALQDATDAEKKSFVGGDQKLRYMGTCKYYSVQTQAGQVEIDPGYAFTEPVPSQIRVERAEVNCGGKQPFGFKEVKVEFGIWKTKKGLFKVYNMTLPGGIPITKEALEHKQVLAGKTYTGTVEVNMWKQGWGFIKTSETLPANVMAKVTAQMEALKAKGKVPKNPDACMLYFSSSDIQEGKWLKKGMDVQFQCYIDDQGAGATWITSTAE